MENYNEHLEQIMWAVTKSPEELREATLHRFATLALAVQGCVMTSFWAAFNNDRVAVLAVQAHMHAELRRLALELWPPVAP